MARELLNQSRPALRLGKRLEAGRLPGRSGQPLLRARAAFSLLEVMVALGLFFMAVFTILALVSQTLRNARALQRPQVDAGLVAALYVSTNKFNEGFFSGDFDDVLKDFSWEVQSYEFATNGLLQADVILNQHGARQPVDTLSILVWDPTFKPGMPGGGFRR